MPRHDKDEVLRLDMELSRILSSLALLLLRHGYGVVRVSGLTKIAFVQAARSICDESKTKANIARIATLTGLTRIEVSRLMRADKREQSSGNNEFNRATKVAIGWMTDPLFADRRHIPRRLQLEGTGASFARLVKEYSGDIPARAMLVEMKRLGMVEQANDKSVSLLRHRPTLPRSTVKLVGAIAPWVGFLANAQSQTDIDLIANAQQRSIYFDSRSQALAAARELEVRRKSFVDALEQIGSTAKATRRHKLTISIAVAAAHSKSKFR